MPRFQLIVAAAFLMLALGIWFVFLRPATLQTATGVIRSKTFEPAGEYVQYQPGSRQGFYAPTTILTSEHFVIGIQVPGRSSELRYAANPTEASGLEIGQEVRIEYQERGVPPIWRRVYVVTLKRPN
jgi:hypothetical protein